MLPDVVLVDVDFAGGNARDELPFGILDDEGNFDQVDRDRGKLEDLRA